MQHYMLQIIALLDVLADLGQSSVRKIQTDIALTFSRQTSEQKAGTATDLQDAPRPQLPEPGDCLFDPDLHLGSRNGVAGVAAVPTGKTGIFGLAVRLIHLL